MGNTSSSGLGLTGSAILAFLVGFLIYRDITSAMYFALYAVGACAMAFLGIIPVIGVIGTHVIIVYLQGWVSQFIGMSWGIPAVYWLYMLLACLYSLVVLGGVVVART